MAKTLRTKSSKSTDEQLQDVPPGWKKMFSNRKNRVYYFNEQTERSVWKLPTEHVPENNQKHKKKSKKKKKKEYFSSELRQEPASQTTPSRPATSKTHRLLPKVKYCSDLSKAVKTDPTFNKTGVQLKAGSLKRSTESDNESDDCKLHRNISCSKQKVPPDLSSKVLPKKLAKKRIAEELLDLEGDVQEDSGESSPNKKRKRCLLRGTDLQLVKETTTASKTEPITKLHSVTLPNNNTQQRKSPHPGPDLLPLGEETTKTSNSLKTESPSCSYNTSSSSIGVRRRKSRLSGVPLQSLNTPTTTSQDFTTNNGTAETSGRKLLQKQKHNAVKSKLIGKVPGQIGGLNSNLNNNSEGLKSPKFVVKKGGAKGRCQSQAAEATSASSHFPQVSQLPSYEEVTTTEGRKSSSAQISDCHSVTSVSPLSCLNTRNLPQRSYGQTSGSNSDISSASSSNIKSLTMANSTTSNTNSVNKLATTSTSSLLSHHYQDNDKVLPKKTATMLGIAATTTDPSNRRPDGSRGLSSEPTSKIVQQLKGSLSKLKGSLSKNKDVRLPGQSPLAAVEKQLFCSSSSVLSDQGLRRRSLEEDETTKQTLGQQSNSRLQHMDMRAEASVSGARTSISSISSDGTGVPNAAAAEFFNSSSSSCVALLPSKASSTETIEEEMEVEISAVEEGEKKVKALYVVVDTNVFISEIDFILELKDQPIADLGPPSIVIPWVVLQELDTVKMGKSPNYVISNDSKNKARTAVNVLNSLLEGKHPRFIGQTAKQNSEQLSWFQVSSNDDRILKCCLQFEQLNGVGSTVLLSNDTNLRSKAVVSDIQCSSKQNFHNWVSQLKPSNHTSSHSPVAIDTSTTAFGGASAAVTRHSSLFTPALSRTSTDGVRNVGLTIPTQLMPQTKTYTEKDLADEVFIEVKTLLKESLSVILEREMKEVYGELWETIVFCKPPWTLLDVLTSIHKHWIAVFGISLDRESNELVKHLMNEFKSSKSCKHNLKECLSVVSSAMSLCQSFGSLQKYSVTMGNVGKKLDVIQKIIVQVISGGLKVARLEVLKGEGPQQRSGTDIDMRPATVTTVTAVTSHSTAQIPSASVSGATGPAVDYSSDVMQCFQTVWDSISYFSGGISERLSTKPEDAARVEVLDFLCKLCANLATLHTVYSKISTDVSRALSLGLFDKLLQVLQRFATDLNVQNMKVPLLVNLKQFFSNITDRVTVESGLSQLEQMMQNLASIQGLLSRDELITIEMYSQRQSMEMGVI